MIKRRLWQLHINSPRKTVSAGCFLAAWLLLSLAAFQMPHNRRNVHWTAGQTSAVEELGAAALGLVIIGVVVWRGRPQRARRSPRLSNSTITGVSTRDLAQRLCSAAERAAAVAPQEQWALTDARLCTALLSLASASQCESAAVAALSAEYHQEMKRLARPPDLAYLECLRLLAQRRRCSNCGYDLRATPDRCPECGAIHGCESEAAC